MAAMILFAALATAQLALYSPVKVAAQDGQRDRLARPVEQVSAWPSREKRFAVIIGVRDYSDSRISPLIAPNEDAHLLYDALVKFADFPRDNITLLASDRPGQYQPTRPIIIEYLSNLKNLLPPDSLLLVAFSGHGIEVDGQAFLLGADARLNENLKVLKDTAISWPEVMDYISDSGARQVVMLLDACRNDPRSARSTPRPSGITQIYSRGIGLNPQKGKIAVYAKLLAASIGEQAWEDAEKGQGFFMGAVVDGISGAAANDDGKVTLAALIKYIKGEVSIRARRRGLTQTPSEEIMNYDQNHLVVSEVEPRPKPAPPPAPVSESMAAYQPDLELTFWKSAEKSDDPAEYEAYLKRYPNGVYVDLAKIRVARLRRPPASSPSTSANAPSQQVAQQLPQQAAQQAAQQPKDTQPKREPKPEDQSRPQGSAEAEKQGEIKRRAQLDQVELAYWKSIANTGDPEVFREYLRLYSKGKFVKEATARLSELQEISYWNSIAQGKSAEPFKEYLQKYPGGKFVAEARARLNELEESAYWSLIIASPDAEKLKAYLLKYPSGKFAREAGARIAELNELSFWNSASASGKPELLKSYMQKYPTGKFAAQAFARILELEEIGYWNGLSNSSDPEAFKTYLRKYPNGRFAASANGRINELAEAAYWNSISGNGTPEDLKAYLDKYPNGRYADQARSRLTGMESNRKAATSAEVYIKNGKKFTDEKRWAEAESEYRRAISLEPKNAALRDSLGWTLASLNRWREAEAELREAARLQPDNSDWRGRLGRILIQQQRWPEAEAETREAVRLDPARAIWHNNLGWALQFQNRWADAEIEYRRAVEMEPGNALFQANLGWCRANQKKWAEAEADLRKVIKLKPGSGEQRGRLGYVLLQQQKWAEAESETREAVKLEPNLAVWHSNLAGALLNQQKWSEAEAEYRQAARLEPDNAVWRGYLGGILFQQQKWAGAEAEYRQAAQLDPRNALYAERLKQSRDYQQKAEAVPAPTSPSRAETEKVKSGDDDSTEPVMLNRPRPVYTKEARKKMVQGKVVMRVLVGADGNVKDVKVVEGLPYGLTEQATAAAYRMRFKPATKDGQPVEQWMNITLDFIL
jgi:TonB family protein